QAYKKTQKTHPRRCGCPISCALGRHFLGGDEHEYSDQRSAHWCNSRNARLDDPQIVACGYRDVLDFECDFRMWSGPINRREFILSGAGFLFQIGRIKESLIIRSEVPADFETPIPLLDRQWLTPNDLHFIRCHLPIPRVDLNTWNLTIEGEVQQPLKLEMKDIHGFRETNQTVTLECSGNGRVYSDPP